MGKKTPKAPAAPDPAATAAAQTASNKETAYWNAVLNNVNQITPYGNLTYQQNPSQPTYDTAYQTKAEQEFASNGYWTNGRGEKVNKAPVLSNFQNEAAPPSFTSTISLSPEQQALYDTQTRSEQGLATLGEQQIGRIGQSVSSPYSYSGIGDAFTAEDAQTASRRGEEALLARLNPQFARDEEALRTRLINQGIGQGSEAYNREMEGLGQTKNDARMQAILSAAGYGGELQNQALARRNQGIQEYSTVRNAPLNEYNAFTSGAQVQNPQFQNTSYQGAQGVDYAGMVQDKYNADMGAYNAKVAGNNATKSALFGLGGQLAGGYAGSAAGSAALTSLFGLSDIRLKEDIKFIGQENGHNIYEFKYINQDGKYIGVMAHEIEKTNPDAVVEIDGYKAVDYSKIGVNFREVA